ncbi:MAG: hypothetical protein L0227_11665 [Chloroflexi bacterium]|nr:hypothetical protein [Chloroflexota bacterium]
MHRGARRTSHRATAMACLAVALLAAACSPAPSPSGSPAPVATPSPAPTPTAEPVAGIDWGEPVRLPGSEFRTSAAYPVSFDGRIIVAATVLTVDGPAIGIWSSTDGIDWTLDMPDALANSVARGLIVGRDQLVLAGTTGVARGASNAPTGGPAIWTSTDARLWTAVDGLPAAAGGGISDIAGDTSGLMAVGYAASPPDGSCPQAAAWRSSNGTTWEALPSPADCSGLTSVAGHGGTFVVQGQVPDPGAPPDSVGIATPAAWLVDGRTEWERLEALPPEARYVAVDGPDGYVAILTALTGVVGTVSPVLVSSDGRTWSRIEGDPFEPDVPNHSPLVALGFADAFFVAWTIGDGQGVGEVHLARSVDGRAWTVVPGSPALNRAMPLSSVLLHNGSVVAFGGRTTIAASVSPPRPGGPSAPVVLEPDVVEAAMPGGGRPRAVVYRGEDALAVGSETDMSAGTTVGRVWRWSTTGDWDAVTATGLDGADLSGLAEGPGGWVAIGTIRRPASAPNQGWEHAPHAWTSSDGRAWAAIPLDADHLGVGIMRLTRVVAGGPGYVLAGWARDVDPACGSGLGFSSVILTSSDGSDWSVAPDPDLGCAQINDIAGADGRLVAVGAESRIVVDPGPSPTPCGLDICVIGGSRPEARASAWVSTDGLEWTAATGIDAIWGRSGLRSAAAGPGGFVATSIGDIIYTSPDGERWTAAYIPIGPTFQSLGHAAGSRSGYLVAGIDQTPEQYRFYLYFSVDGTTWQEVATDALPLDPGTYIAAMDGDDAGFLVLGTEPAAPPANVSWQVSLP